MFENNLGISATEAANIFRWFPIGAALITPFLGGFLDKKGKGASMLILGAILMITCHLIFALVLPKYPNLLLAYSAIVVLGVSFSLVPAALWPSVPKLMPERYLGSAYSLIFWVQNVGLCLVPLLIGIVLDSTNPGISDAFKNKSQTETLQAKVDYIDQINALEADIKGYEEYVAELNAAEQEITEENQYASFDVAAAETELQTLIDGKAAKGISDNFDYDQAMAELDALRAEKIEKNLTDTPKYNYTTTMLIFVSFGVLALFFGFWLKIEDKKKGYGLELPNIKNQAE
jgi:hypothetical protein